jgi:cell division protein FtsB
MQGLLVRIALSVVGFLTFAIVLLTLFNDNGYFAVRQQKQTLAALQQENASIIEENKKLREDIEALKTDPFVIEKIAREELKLVRPGEIVIETTSPAKE